MAKTVREEYVFVVKEFGDGTPWIALEPSRKAIDLSGDGFLGFDLAKGTNIDKARDIAKYLNENIEKLSLTSF